MTYLPPAKRPWALLVGIVGLVGCSSSGQGAANSASGGASASGGNATVSHAGTGAVTPGGSAASAGGNGGGATSIGGSPSASGGNGPSSGGTPATGGNAQTGGASSGGSVGNGGTSAGGDSASGGSGGVAVPVGMGELGPADYAQNELDAASDGATITFQNVGGTGWYPSRRDPATGPCDVVNTATCCMTQHQIDSDQLTPWNEELSMTIRGPMAVKQIVAYQPGAGDTWARVSAWDSRGTKDGIAFWGSGAMNGFDGRIGNICEAEVAPDMPYPAGPGSVPYCPAGNNLYYGFGGSKLIVVLGWDPHQGSGVLDDVSCGPASNGWNDAPWIGLTHGELVRSGRYSDCQCWSKPGNPYAQDGCGQFNVFEVVNDNNQYANFDIFSTNLVSYAGYIGEGPCGNNCN
ncbi:MAG TPA: DUF2403 domain-containing protein, partial [Polyangiaceae bacterium]|nr:DUF2403 domain-containing protein [Polyangiaceae bacterium]